MELTDAQIIELVLAGETGFFERLMRRYNQKLFYVIRSVIENDPEAEEVLQDSWVSAFEHLAQFEGRSSLVTWLSRIALRRAFRYARKRRMLVGLENSDGEMTVEAVRASGSARDPEQRMMRREIEHALQLAIDRLPDSYRSVFMLREVKQMSTIEVAESLNLSEEAVKTRLFRSRRLLRKYMEGHAGGGVVGAYSFGGEHCDRTVAAVMERIRVSNLQFFYRSACNAASR